MESKNFPLNNPQEKNLKLEEMESQGRKEILDYIKHKRQERDVILNKLDSPKTKVLDSLRLERTDDLKFNALLVEVGLYAKVSKMHEELNSKILKTATGESGQIDSIFNKIETPLQRLQKLCVDLDDEEVNNSKHSEEIRKILEKIELKSIEAALSNPVLQSRMITILSDFALEMSNSSMPSLAKSAYREILEMTGKSLHSSLENSKDIKDRVWLLIDRCLDSNISIDENLKRDFLDVFGRSEWISKSNFENLKFLANVPHLADSWFKSEGNDDLKTNILSKINRFLENEDWSEVEEYFRSHSDFISQFTKLNLAKTLEKYGINLNDMQNAWKLDIKQHYPNKIKEISPNVWSIASLEGARSGIAQNLSSNFGIKEFRRWPQEILIEQYDNCDKNIPYGIYMVTNNDYNDAFDRHAPGRSKSQNLVDLFNKLKTRGIGLRITEFETPFDVMKRLAHLNQQYGAEHKITYMIFGAHGKIDSTGGIKQEYLLGSGVKRMRDFFIPRPEIILSSCSTGAEGGIGQEISNVFEGHVIAMKESTYLKSLSVDFDSNGAPKFDAQFGEDEDLKVKYSMGLKN